MLISISTFGKVQAINRGKGNTIRRWAVSRVQHTMPLVVFPFTVVVIPVFKLKVSSAIAEHNPHLAFSSQGTIGTWRAQQKEEDGRARRDHEGCRPPETNMADCEKVLDIIAAMPTNLSKNYPYPICAKRFLFLCVATQDYPALLGVAP